MTPPWDDATVTKLAASGLGSLVSLKFMNGTAVEKLLMFTGGSALAYFANEPLTAWIGAGNIAGLVGFMSGLLGMTIIAKVFEVVAVIDAKTVAADFWNAVKRKWGA